MKSVSPFDTFKIHLLATPFFYLNAVIPSAQLVGAHGHFVDQIYQRGGRCNSIFGAKFLVPVQANQYHLELERLCSEFLVHFFGISCI